VYSTCLFCHASLGANEVIEQFPIGRRLAFDGTHGRLWVVCAKCRRWNLTPLEERWEAIEECERRYRTARVRTSTDQIGLARLGEGLELVRIGAPPRAELAAWQYVDVFRRRRQRAIVLAAIGGTVMVGAGVAWAAIASASVLIQLSVQTLVNVGRGPSVRVPGPGGKRMVLTGPEVSSLQVIPPKAGTELSLWFKRERFWRESIPTTFEGDHAERALRPILARLNRFSGRASEIQLAVDQLNQNGDPMAIGHEGFGHKPFRVKSLNAIDRLSLEMSLAERDEQRLLAGELASLTAAWREAEEIAAIADDLFVPESVMAWLRRQKSNQDRSAT
jgi:hypothetical protein